MHIGVEILVGVALVRIDPGDDEHGQPLRHRPANERLLGIEVEDVEFVDPRRHDQQRAFEDFGRGRLVLDQLHQHVAEDHLAGRRGEVDAELERARVGLANAQIAVAGLDVFGQHFQAPHEVLAAFGKRRAQQLRIGGQEVRGRERRGDLAQIELRLVALMRIEFVGAPDQIVGPARRQHIGLLDEIEVRIVPPRGVGEALVGGVRRGDRRRLLALQPLQRRGPEVDEPRRQRRLRRERPLRIGEVIFGDPADRLDHLADVVGDRRLDRSALARAQVGGQRLAALLDRGCDVAGERFHVGRRMFGARAGRLWRARRRRRRPAARRPSRAAAEAADSAGAGAVWTSAACRRCALRGAGALRRGAAVSGAAIAATGGPARGAARRSSPEASSAAWPAAPGVAPRFPASSCRGSWTGLRTRL